MVEGEQRLENGERMRLRFVPALGREGDVVRIYASALREAASPERESLEGAAASPA